MESLLYGFLGILEFSFVFSSMIPCTEYVAGAVSEVIRDMGNVLFGRLCSHGYAACAAVGWWFVFLGDFLPFRLFASASFCVSHQT